MATVAEPRRITRGDYIRLEQVVFDLRDENAALRRQIQTMKASGLLPLSRKQSEAADEIAHLRRMNEVLLKRNEILARKQSERNA